MNRMTRNEKIRSAVYTVIDELNEQLPSDQKLAKSETTVLTGPRAVLDSLGLVNLVVLLEQTIESEFEASINLIEDDVLSSPTHLADVASLTRYLDSILPNRAVE